MIQPPLLGVVNAAGAISARTRGLAGAPAGAARSCSDAVGVHGRAGAPVPPNCRRSRRRRSLDPDIAGVERKGVAAFDAVTLESLAPPPQAEEETGGGSIAVLRIEDQGIFARRPKPGAVAHPAGGAGVLLLWRALQGVLACHGSTSGTPQSQKPPISRVTTPEPLRARRRSIDSQYSSGAVGRPALGRAAIPRARRPLRPPRGVGRAPTVEIIGDIWPEPPFRERRDGDVKA